MKVVHTISFSPDAVTFAYVDEVTDVRAEGLIYQTHTMVVARVGAGLDDEVREMEEGAADLLVQAIASWASSMPFDMDEAIRRADDRQAQLSFDDDDDDG